MPNLGTTELMIIFGIVIILFGAGRVGKIGTELGEGIRGFKKGIEEDVSTED